MEPCGRLPYQAVSSIAQASNLGAAARQKWSALGTTGWSGTGRAPELGNRLPYRRFRVSPRRVILDGCQAEGTRECELGEGAGRGAGTVTAHRDWAAGGAVSERVIRGGSILSNLKSENST